MNLDDHNDLCVGIDLGTTNSVLATINVKPNGDAISKVVDIHRAVDMFNNVSGAVRLTMQKKATLPSCVYYREDKGYDPLVGDFAKMQYSLRPHLVAKSIKSKMGNPEASGLAEGVPDKTPAEVSARILKHMIKQAEKVFQCNIDDAVITVPANFDSVMCQATREAAKLAGIKIYNDDGSERPVLLSEPNAVIYDLINQIHNGEISNRIINLDQPKNVLVFDLGGGTLDITMHNIRRREDCPDILKVSEIATNRYTLLGGDDFDELLANEMYERYKKQYTRYPDVLVKLRNAKNAIMPQLLTYAEDLKLEVSESGNNDDEFDGWGDEDDNYTVGGNMGGIGYAYDDTFTKEEVEGILETFMGRDLKFEDYSRVDNISSTRNIIYPILDVLNKAGQKSADGNVKVDAIIVNGGMSKFYMVIDRLREFFGMEPIVALDPDQSVARGAAVYHYYLHKYEAIQDDMRMLGDSAAVGSSDATKTEIKKDSASKSEVAIAPASISNGYSPKKEAMARALAMKQRQVIEMGDVILNDALYLGVRNGAVQTIVPTGAALPYQSEVMTGFQIIAGQNRIDVPVKSRNLDGTYRTIACGHINFSRNYKENTNVAISVYMSISKVISISAWTYEKDVEHTLEAGTVKLVIENSTVNSGKVKFIPPKGTELNPQNEISNLRNLCSAYERARVANDKKNKMNKLKAAYEVICSAGNKKDFSIPVLHAIASEKSNECRQRLIVIARRMMDEWTDQERKRLAELCMDELSAAIMGFSAYGAVTNVISQAIYTLGCCGSKEQINRLESLHGNNRFYQACLYAHGKSRTMHQWLYEEFLADCKKLKSSSYKQNSGLQSTAYALGMALRKDNEPNMHSLDENKVVKDVCNTVESGRLDINELVCCLLAIGWCCDQRYGDKSITMDTIKKAEYTVDSIRYWYQDDIVLKCNKVSVIVKKMLHGETLTEADEEFLLLKLTI